MLAQRDMFRFLLGAGIVVSISVQVLINLVVVTAVTPTKGIALPFISAGGSSLAMSLFAVGILINLARTPLAEAPDVPVGGGHSELLERLGIRVITKGGVNHG